jgi:hypothetical protein
MRQQNRQAVTKTALLSRLRDAELDRLPDRRGRRGRRHAHIGLVMALALGAVAALRSLREVEALTADLRAAVRRRSQILGRISDTKLRDTLLRLRPEETRHAIHRQVKAEHRRGKQPSGEIHGEALRLMADLGSDQAEVSETRHEKGARVTHRLYRVTVRGFLDWTHARQLVRVERSEYRTPSMRSARCE